MYGRRFGNKLVASLVAGLLCWGERELGVHEGRFRWRWDPMVDEGGKSGAWRNGLAEPSSWQQWHIQWQHAFMVRFFTGWHICWGCLYRDRSIKEGLGWSIKLIVRAHPMAASYHGRVLHKMAHWFGVHVKRLELGNGSATTRLFWSAICFLF